MENFLNIANIIALLTLAIALIFAIYQIIEMKRATYATSFDIIMNILQTKERREERRIVMEVLKEKEIKNWTPEERIAAENVCQSYDTAGIMIKNRMLPVDIIADSWGNSIRTTWKILKPLVLEYREKRNSLEFWDDFEWLANKAGNFHKPMK